MSLDTARAALDRGDFAASVAALDADAAARETADGLELLAQAAYGHGDFERAVASWERLHAVQLAAGDEPEAARAAAMVAMYLMMDTGLMSPVRGWLQQAERLVAGHPDAVAHAIVAMTRTYERFMCGDMAAARRHSTEAIALGDRLGFTPATVIGRVAAARVTIFEGDLDDGLAQLDEVGALLMSGSVDPLTTGMMYCELICAAQGLGLHRRANEWTDTMQRWRTGAAFGGINGRCRVHRAEMLRLSGPCDEAEQEALGACDELRPWMRREFGWPLNELGMIRLRKGDLVGAEEAFLAAHAHAWSVQPGLALLRLEQGDANTAADLIDDAIEHPFDIPSKERPPFGDLRLAPLLDAQVAIAAARGDAVAARTATERLSAIAQRYPGPSLAAATSLARARLALLDGELDAAATHAAAAAAGWADVGAPFESATARMVLADVHRRAGRGEAARLEFGAARQAFESFGAAAWAERARRLTDADTEPAGERRASTAAVFRREGDRRVIDFGGTPTSTRDLKGFHYLDRLLSDPQREFHVLDLVAAEEGTLPTGEVVDDPDDGLEASDGALPVLDDVARDAYRRRLAEVDDDIEQAERDNDLARAELARRDREYLVAELARAAGLGGRLRSTGSTAERARTAVTRSIRYSLRRLREVHPEVAAHLECSIRTGTYCSYTPDPDVRIAWDTSAGGSTPPA